MFYRRVLIGVVTRHDGLEDTRKGSHANARGNQYRVRSVKNVIRWRTVRSTD